MPWDGIIMMDNSEKEVSHRMMNNQKHGIFSYPNIYSVRPEFQLNNSTEALYSY